MKLTLRQIDRAVAALAPFVENLEAKNARLVYRLGRNLDRLSSELGVAAKRRDKIANAFKIKDKDGNYKTEDITNAEGKVEGQRFVFEPGAEEEIENQLRQLNEEVVEVDIHVIPVSWLNGVMGKQGPMMTQAGFLFTEDEILSEGD